MPPAVINGCPGDPLSVTWFVRNFHKIRILYNIHPRIVEIPRNEIKPEVCTLFTASDKSCLTCASTCCLSVPGGRGETVRLPAGWSSLADTLFTHLLFEQSSLQEEKKKTPQK